jgi:hypothetical protein
MTDIQIVKKAVERGFTLRYSIKIKVELLEAELEEERKYLLDLCYVYLFETHPVGCSLLMDRINEQKAKMASLRKRIKIVQSLGDITKKPHKDKITDEDIELAMQADPSLILGQPVRKHGDEWIYHSPLRKDKKPSFSFNVKKGVWIDWGVGDGGSIINLVMILEGCNFTTAVIRLKKYS